MDTAARYGGEEFAVILPESSPDEALQVAERLRQASGSMALPTGPLRRGVTISAGVALAPAHGETPEQLVRAADQALYRAKRTGKNRVVVAG
jgi:diguanylate cyclase (GGDEF)-like protein